MKAFLIFLLLICFPLMATGKDINANHLAISYSGRIDFSKGEQAIIIWQGSEVNLRFTGTSLALEFASLTGQVFFNLDIDGESSVIAGKNGWVKMPTLAPGAHSVTLFKRSEASAGTIALKSIRIDDDAELLPVKAPPSQRPRYIFYGDSITVGACNEDGQFDQWEDRSTHNNALSYAAITAEKMNAEYRSIAVSGIGISIGYQPYTVDQIWNRVYPDPKAPLATPEQWQPDIVFLNYGENDDSFSKNHQLPFPTDYVDRYVQLVKQMRKTYPDSNIVILRGGMYGGARSKRLIKAWEKVVTRLENEDDNIHHFVFHHWYKYHPRVGDHLMMAKELTDWLKNLK